MRAGKVIGLLAGGCLVLALVLVVGTVVGFRWFTSDPTGVEVRATTPLEVRRGDRFTLAAVVENTARRPQKLVDVDVAESYLEGLVVEKSEPPFSDAMHVPIDDTVSYSFDRTLQPGEKLEVRFTVYAAHPGDFSGDVDFCINSQYRFVSYPVRTIVKEP